MTTGTILLISGGGVLALGGITAVYLLFKRHCAKLTDAEQTHETLKPKQAQVNTPPNEASNELASHADTFIGLYESLWMVKNGQIKPNQSIFSEWDIRIDGLKDAPALTAFWNENFAGYESWNEHETVQKNNDLLAFIEAAGISRSKETEVIVDRDVLRRYFAKDGVRLEPGTTSKVEQPYWYVDERILEKGIICAAHEN